MCTKTFASDIILNFTSMTPIKWKRSLILWFLNREKVVSSSDTILQKRNCKTERNMARNGYPMKFVDYVLERFGDNNIDCPKEKLNIPDFRNIIKVPYIAKPSMGYKNKL